MTKIALPTERPAERTVLVGVEFRDQPHALTLDDSLQELGQLCETAGMLVVGDLMQRLDTPNPKTFIGPGKVAEMKAIVEETKAQAVVFDEELSPRHQRELEKTLGLEVKLLDRTALILDIFAQHASTREGALQVELAQYEYRLPRLTRAWTHLARQAGGSASARGGVGLRGPGETQLEVDRRDIGRRITHLKYQLEKVRASRSRARRNRRLSAVPVVAVVGYTNAGKSTLLNALSDAKVYVADQLFATLDPTTRKVQFADGGAALFTDTVGFIQKLPTTLVAAFRATLEEIAEADLLLHVIDASHPNMVEQSEVVLETLESIGATKAPIITVLNKIDRLEVESLADAVAEFPGAVPVSALQRLGLDNLLVRVRQAINEMQLPIEVTIPYGEGRLISLFYERGDVQRVQHLNEGVFLMGRIPQGLVGAFIPFMPKEEEPLLPSALLEEDLADLDEHEWHESLAVLDDAFGEDEEDFYDDEDDEEEVAA